jgi:hypothetical protein
MDWRLLSRGDIAAILVVVAIIVSALLVDSTGDLHVARFRNMGFGPEWTCTYPGSGEPVCVENGTAKADDADRTASKTSKRSNAAPAPGW